MDTHKKETFSSELMLHMYIYTHTSTYIDQRLVTKPHFKTEKNKIRVDNELDLKENFSYYTKSKNQILVFSF